MNTDVGWSDEIGWSQALVTALMSFPKFEPDIEREIAKIKSRAEAWADQEAIKEAQELASDAKEKDIKSVAWGVCAAVHELLYDEIHGLPTSERFTTSSQHSAFYREAEHFQRNGKHSYGWHLVELIQKALQERKAAEEKSKRDLSRGVQKIEFSKELGSLSQNRA